MEHLNTFDEFLNEGMYEPPYIKKFENWKPKKGTIQEYLFNELTAAFNGEYDKKKMKELWKWYAKNKHLEDDEDGISGGVVGVQMVLDEYERVAKSNKSRDSFEKTGKWGAGGLNFSNTDAKLRSTYYYQVRDLSELDI